MYYRGKNIKCLLSASFIKKETLAQVFSCEFCDISKKTFCQRTLLVAASNKWCIRSVFRYLS